ncbi:MAG: DHH family phosphoesterase [Nanoarchaeota archaeon]|nr:DHH family phosphoesterase [Nanoarchaeota archaeon]
MQKVVETIKQMIKNLEHFQRVLVVYHFDVDGCVSASILWRIFNKLKINAEFFPATRGHEDIVINKVKKNGYEKIILVDYVPGEKLSKELMEYNVDVIDHHQHEKHLEVFNYLTTADFGYEVSTSYTLSKVAEEFGIKELEWLAFLGAFWDKCLEKTEFYKKGIYKEKMNEMLPFNLVVSFTQTRGSIELFEILNSSKNEEEALEKVKELETYKVAKKTFDNEFEKINTSKKEYKDISLEIYFVKTKFKHIRIYVDYITYSGEGTFIFILDEKTRYKFSFRTTFNINLVEIIRKLSKKIKNFNGGGHPQACGGILMGRNLNELIEEFIKEYKDYLYTSTQE